MQKKSLYYKVPIGFIVLIMILGLFYGWEKGNIIYKSLSNTYNQGRSIIIYDRQGNIIKIKPNQSDYYATYLQKIPNRFRDLLIQKEDKLFYFHPGVNPGSIIRASFNQLLGGRREGASTITQQLSKILLGNENQRNFKNKIKEVLCSFVLETFSTKEQILLWYLNSVYFGNGTQGIAEASRLYFDTSTEILSDSQILQLLATINSPTDSNPFTEKNIIKASQLANNFKINNVNFVSPTIQEIEIKKKKFFAYHQSEINFELDSIGLDCTKDCHLNVDEQLTVNLRQIMKRNLEILAQKNTTNAAIVVLREPKNELLAIVGSPDPTINAYGYKINMAIKPRPIGSTIKPFIYLQGFEKGLRPYTKVVDKEYKYIINDGFAFYPKNYDYRYHGEVNLHYSLSNSLNVPSIKVLEYIGLDNFQNFLLNDLGLRPLQNIATYGLGTALGGIEMDLLSLSYYFSILPNQGLLTSLEVAPGGQKINYASTANFSQNKIIGDKKYIELLNKILSDRLTGVEQFGLKSSLNLPSQNYAVKTGTSREFHDSWTIGYTPDFVVGVWVGNSDNTAMDKVSGQLGAGKIWQETMNLLLNSQYNRRTKFNFSDLREFRDQSGLEYGLQNDNYDQTLNLLSDNSLIQKPHNNDIFLFEKNTQIICQSAKDSLWTIDNKKMGRGKEIIFVPPAPGKYEITADNIEIKESIIISVKNND